MIHAGVGETQVANILAEMNIPQPTPRTVKKCEREIGKTLEKAADISCLAELEREKENSNCSEDRGAKVILDGGWQKRGSGRTNNSMSGINTSIIQMAMTHAESNQTFSCYVKPKCGFIPNNITKLTGIMLRNNIMYHNGIEVNPLDIKEACRQKMQFLKQFAPVILVAHNVLFDSKVLIQNMNECSLTCDRVIDGFGDTLRLFKNECPERKTNGQNYKQEDLVRDILGKDYNAHSAIADTNELLQLVRTVYNFEEKLPVYDNIEIRIKRCSNQAKYSASYADIVGKCYLLSAASKTLATAGLSFHHIKIIHSRSVVDGLTALCKQILSNPQKVASSISKYLS